jgi:hypothetical protein
MTADKFTGAPIPVFVEHEGQEIHTTAFVTDDGIVTVIDPIDGCVSSTQIGASAKGTARMLLRELIDGRKTRLGN